MYTGRRPGRLNELENAAGRVILVTHLIKLLVLSVRVNEVILVLNSANMTADKLELPAKPARAVRRKLDVGVLKCFKRNWRLFRNLLIIGCNCISSTIIAD